MRRVEEIVNQSVAALPRPADARVATFRPGWFHAGASKPDFNHGDVRTTQAFPYEKHEYVTSDLNPGVMFRGSELEFNSMTKYFYKDLSLPKKRLSEAEMLEINRLYRIIGRAEQLAAASPERAPIPAPPPQAGVDPPPAHYLYGGLALVLVLLGVLLWRRRASG